jgi:DNA-binding protein YbaB
MGMFGQAKDLYKLQKQAKQIKKELKNLQIEAEVNGIVVTVTAEQEVVEIKIPDERMTAEGRIGLQNDVMAAINKAVKKSQEVAAEKMKGLMGNLGMDLPGLDQAS